MNIVTFSFSDKITRYPLMAESRYSAQIPHKHKILSIRTSINLPTYCPNKHNEGKIGWKCSLPHVDA